MFGSLVFGSKNMQFHIICSFWYSISINTIEDDPHSDSLQNSRVKPKNKPLRKPLPRSRRAVSIAIQLSSSDASMDNKHIEPISKLRGKVRRDTNRNLICVFLCSDHSLFSVGSVR